MSSAYEEGITLPPPTPRSVFQGPYGQVYYFYLSGYIGDPEEYGEWVQKIRTADESDIVMIFVNSPGGSAATTIQLINAMRSSSAKVMVSVEGECMSAATLILLAADVVEVTDHSIFMIHNFSANAFGKGGEMKDQVNFLQDWSETLMKDLYEGFLSPTEIQSVLDNRDFWMTADEVTERLKKRKEFFESKEEEKTEDLLQKGLFEEEGSEK